ncbi:LCP family protein [Glycomyces sp. TRM65418]|uniref:LCP family protein n=1 Tax=Glycomyces sp. TRM65418 TaxID=2867006 RepID=UPI001CE4FB8E|nr:LCP family protein [Glycomyces sp. TRM65418]MCC3765948.1 LCP family protein [Glycomyces sp. TRM65418]QZD55530.1 LCP family protein [Glycomyces sp. TRM65418]
MAGKSGAPWWAHTMLYAGGLTMVVAGGAAAVTQIGLNTANSAVAEEDILDNRAEMDVENIEGPLNILVLGVDKQGGSTRSDTMIMVHVNEGLSEVSMVSLPRDLYVEIPDCGPDYNSPCMQKLNHAASISDDWTGVTLPNVVSTIDNLTGVEFHMAATVDFNGFMDLVDLVGEIELCPWHEITSIHGEKKTYPEGCAYYGKEDALDLIRQRYGWDDPEDWENGLGGDYGRQAMQQQAIKSLIKELKADGVHKDVGLLTDVLEGLEGKLTMDLPEGLTMVDLAMNLRDLDPEDITSIRVPASTEVLDVGESEVIHEGEQQIAADALWSALQDDTMDQWIAQYPEWVKQTGNAGTTTGTTDETSGGVTTD